MASGKIAIDPELGRIQYGPGITPPQSLQVNYLYGFPAAIGGGPYDRSAALAQLDPADADYFAIVGSSDLPRPLDSRGRRASEPGRQRSGSIAASSCCPASSR